MNVHAHVKSAEKLDVVGELNVFVFALGKKEVEGFVKYVREVHHFLYHTCPISHPFVVRGVMVVNVIQRENESIDQQNALKTSAKQGQATKKYSLTSKTKVKEKLIGHANAPVSDCGRKKPSTKLKFHQILILRSACKRKSVLLENLVQVFAIVHAVDQCAGFSGLLDQN